MSAPIVAARVTAAAAKDFGPWTGAWPAPIEVSLAPTPLDTQPSAYIQQVWRDRAYGATPFVKVSAASSPRALHLRLEWPAESPRFGLSDNNVFADACGVMFPASAGAPPAFMGTPGSPVETWYWRAGAETPFVASAEGAGTVTRRASHDLTAAAEWRAGSWAVVFAYPTHEGEGPLREGSSVPVAFAAWCGAAEERAGLAAYSPTWYSLTVNRPIGARR